ncbi:adenosylcobalamin biosynthesis protein CobP [Seminavis robusta]|uniref:Adenosylcobinamide kinase n=1 Tax=Seminavis robusta TaxID=568900 RepID=A0A9N8HF44_9STRA|nr:adenosylcobalamin biosynthesis protein CobP [Seminavis robusta]|eukprot:Sro439_g143270.1 adenosylcobalamin biosynthesis protein CobP (354) ;mRNA; r:51695-52756
MPATVYLVTGGCRSGKSSHAERLCEELSQNPIYLATAASAKLAGDQDFAQRIARHQEDRKNKENGCQWTTIEEPLRPSNHAKEFSEKVVLVDCLTLWLTNWMMEEGAFSIIANDDASNKNDVSSSNKEEATAAVDRAMKNLQQEFDKLIAPYNVTFVVVTNEVGSGTHADTHITRKFVDAQGWCNQFVASKAQQVIHMVCGIPHVLKNELGKKRQSASATVATLQTAQRLNRHLSTRTIPMDAKGYFLIKTDVEESLIVASFHSCILNDKGEVCDLKGNKIGCHGNNRPDPMKVWKCRTAKELTTEVFERWEDIDELKLSVGHAAYIGREAQKAENALYHHLLDGSAGIYRQD